jgi:hypothetical protein
MPSASRAVTLCGAIAALALTATTGRAQTTPFDPSGLPVRIGAHLRVRGPGEYSSVFRGRLQSMTDDSIALALDTDPGVLVPFAISDIGRAEVERDAHSRDQATAVMGVLGAAGGVTAAVYWCKHNPADCDSDVQKTFNPAPEDSDYVSTSLLMVLGGTLLGALVGYALAPAPHWDVVIFPMRTSRYDGTSRTLLNVGVSYSFGSRRRR